MYNSLIQLALGNFSLVLFILAIILILFNLLIRRKTTRRSSIIYRWITLLPLGIALLFAFFIHAFYADIAATTLGWDISPFQFEVAMANLGFGVVGVLAFFHSFGFRLANVIGSTCYLWGDAVGHIRDMILHHTFNPGPAGSWFVIDIIVPLILIICIIRLARGRKNVAPLKTENVPPPKTETVAPSKTETPYNLNIG